ncbi:MAG: TIM-barrel domain-containing protein [Bacillota bacterium]
MEFTTWCRRGGQWQEVGDGTQEAHGARVTRLPLGPRRERIQVRFAEPAAVELVAIRFRATPDEHFFGFGEKFNALDQRGRLVDLWVRNGASGDETYKPVPFWMSTGGYACALETDRHAWVAVAHPLDPGAVFAAVEGADLDVILFTGDTLKDLLSAYTEWVGRPPCPPAWAFGPWKSRDWRVEDAATVQVDLDKHRELGLPLSVKLIDAGWSTEPNNFLWDRRRYPDPEGLVRRVREAGCQLVVWACPWFIEGTTIFREVTARGWSLRRPDGQPYLHRLANSPDLMGCLLDFTHPEAVAWWQEGLRSLMDLGIRGIKTDFGEQVPADAVAHDGRTGTELHNAYPRLYNGATWAVVDGYGGILLARSAWAGSQRYPGVWAGDQTGDFSPWSGLPSVVLAGQSAGLSGFPLWGSDIGGYFDGPTPECFIRWSQFGAFSPIMQIHGLGEHDPWNLGPEALANYREYAVLRARLLPYIYTQALEASRTGLPLMRALPLEFQDDPGVHAHDFAAFEYLFGDSLLVAPVSWDSVRRRRVYLPAGAAWVDWYEGRRLEGGQVIEAEAPIERIPLFVREGSVIPLQRSTDAPGGPDREVRFYPSPAGECRRTLHDGSTYTCRREGDLWRASVRGAPPGLSHRLALWTPSGWREADLATGRSEVIFP